MGCEPERRVTAAITRWSLGLTDGLGIDVGGEVARSSQLRKTGSELYLALLDFGKAGYSSLSPKGGKIGEPTAKTGYISAPKRNSMFKQGLGYCAVLRPDHNLNIKALCHLAGAN